MLFRLIILLLGLFGTFSVYGESFQYQFMDNSSETNMGNLLNESKNAIQDFTQAVELTDDTATGHIQSVINFFLSMIAFIALIMIMYGFYLILFSGKGEEAVGKAKKYLFGGVIALVVSGVSWYVVSLMFHIFERTK